MKYFHNLVYDMIFYIYSCVTSFDKRSRLLTGVEPKNAAFNRRKTGTKQNILMLFYFN